MFFLISMQVHLLLKDHSIDVTSLLVEKLKICRKSNRAVVTDSPPVVSSFLEYLDFVTI